MSKGLTIEEMLVAPDLDFKDVPAWGSVVHLSTLNAAEMLTYSDLVDQNGPIGSRESNLVLAMACMIGDDGQRLMELPSVNETEKIAAFKQRLAEFMKKDSRTVGRLAAAARKLNSDRADTKNDSGETASDVSPTA